MGRHLWTPGTVRGQRRVWAKSLDPTVGLITPPGMSPAVSELGMCWRTSSAEAGSLGPKGWHWDTGGEGCSEGCPWGRGLGMLDEKVWTVGCSFPSCIVWEEEVKPGVGGGEKEGMEVRTWRRGVGGSLCGETPQPLHSTGAGRAWGPQYRPEVHRAVLFSSHCLQERVSPTGIELCPGQCATLCLHS